MPHSCCWLLWSVGRLVSQLVAHFFHVLLLFFVPLSQTHTHTHSHTYLHTFAAVVVIRRFCVHRSGLHSQQATSRNRMTDCASVSSVINLIHGSSSVIKSRVFRLLFSIRTFFPSVSMRTDNYSTSHKFESWRWHHISLSLGLSPKGEPKSSNRSCILERTMRASQTATKKIIGIALDINPNCP